MRPIRCYTCGKVLGNKWEVIDTLISRGETLKEIYEFLGIRRYCCKRVIMTSVPIEVEPEYYNSEKIKINHENVEGKFIKIE
jgi:DNA-directed RNA polymerase subunit N (RpoN/RPB10)